MRAITCAVHSPCAGRRVVLNEVQLLLQFSPARRSVILTCLPARSSVIGRIASCLRQGRAGSFTSSASDLSKYANDICALCYRSHRFISIFKLPTPSIKIINISMSSPARDINNKKMAHFHRMHVHYVMHYLANPIIIIIVINDNNKIKISTTTNKNTAAYYLRSDNKIKIYIP